MANDQQSTFAVDNVGQPEQVVAATPCNRITIYEHNNATQDYRVRKGVATNIAITHAAGSATTFTKRGSLYQVGEVAGYVETVTGSITMAQVEEITNV